MQWFKRCIGVSVNIWVAHFLYSVCISPTVNDDDGDDDDGSYKFLSDNDDLFIFTIYSNFDTHTSHKMLFHNIQDIKSKLFDINISWQMHVTENRFADEQIGQSYIILKNPNKYTVIVVIASLHHYL